MSKELLLYNNINNWIAAGLITQIHECEGNPTRLRVNSPGGDPLAGYGLCAKVKEHGNINISVDACADSMAFYLLLYAKNVECLDVSTFGIHRAAFLPWVTPAEEDKAQLALINANLKKMSEEKFDADKYKKIVGYTIDQMFDETEERITVVINAEDAKKLGVVQKVNKLTPELIAAFNTRYAIAAETDPEEKPKNHTMTKEEFQLKNPTAYAEIMKEGITSERSRVEAYLVYADVDLDAVKKGIEEGKPLEAKMMAEMNRKMISGAALAGATADSVGAVTTSEPTVGATTTTGTGGSKPEDVAKLEASLDKLLGLSK